MFSVKLFICLMKKLLFLAASAAILFPATLAAQNTDETPARNAPEARRAGESISFELRHTDEEDKESLIHFETAPSSQTGTPAVTVDLTGTVRAKFEYQPTEGNARFDVRTARFGVGGNIYSHFLYKMEIDLSDEGRMRMVDAYVGAKIWKGLGFSIGYMRVPFSIDAHRSPHLQLFANRSFIAKQTGNVRDVGATLGWKFGTKIPVNVQLGMFNGSGLAEGLQSYWTDTFNYSAKVQAGFVPGLNFVASWMTTLPRQTVSGAEDVQIHLYDIGITYQTGRWIVEGEYLRKEYGGAFDGVNAVDAFVGYGLPIHNSAFRKISFLGRYDYLDDHSNGIAVAGANPGAIPGAPGNLPALAVNDPGRHRATAGVTFSLGLPFEADIRLNYEKYFYTSPDAVPGASDHDKIVVELMAHF